MGGERGCSGLSQWFGLGLSVMALGMLVGGCTPKSKSAISASQRPKVVSLAIWSNYLAPELLAEFERKTGIRVQVSNFSSNEELLAKLQAGASGYDVVVPSDYMVYAMIKLGLLRALDYQRLPNRVSLDPKYLKKNYDPENKFSLPYDWGTTGIAINRALYSGKVESWKDLFTKEDLAGKFSLLDDAREVMGAALKSLGYSLNSKNPQEVKKAKEVLKKTWKRVKTFTSEPMMPLIHGEVAVAHVYASDALQARKATQGKIDYVIPSEGGTFWIDSLVIPASATHVEEAHVLINFLLEGSSNVTTVKNVWVAPTTKDAFAMLPKEMQENSMLFPPLAVMAKAEMIEDLGDFLTSWDRAWTEIKAHRD
jgi:spermidine/putrescine transport system substrate-binding protein